MTTVFNWTTIKLKAEATIDSSHFNPSLLDSLFSSTFIWYEHPFLMSMLVQELHSCFLFYLPFLIIKIYYKYKYYYKYYIKYRTDWDWIYIHLTRIPTAITRNLIWPPLSLALKYYKTQVLCLDQSNLNCTEITQIYKKNKNYVKLRWARTSNQEGWMVNEEEPWWITNRNPGERLLISWRFNTRGILLRS